MVSNLNAHFYSSITRIFTTHFRITFFNFNNGIRTCYQSLVLLRRCKDRYSKVSLIHSFFSICTACELLAMVLKLTTNIYWIHSTLDLTMAKRYVNLLIQYVQPFLYFPNLELYPLVFVALYVYKYYMQTFFLAINIFIIWNILFRSFT